MRVAVATDVRYARDAAGRIHCRSGGTAYAFWQRYLAVFDEVRVIARVFDAPAGATLDGAPAGAALDAPVEGPGVHVSPLPGFDGPRGLALHAPAVVASAWRGLADTPAVIVRGPATVGFLCARLARLRRQPVGVEVVGDPLDIFGAGVGRGAAPVFREIFVRDLRWQCAHACAVAYVTAGTLQARYPVRPGVFVTHYSSVDLGPEAVVATPRVHAGPQAAPRLVTVGQLEQLYKGTDVLLGALRRLVADGLDARLTIVGDGRFRPFLEDLAGRLGVRERVTFAGLVPAGAGVRACLDPADLFVLPSRAEGLPRALIEAMARALPAIGTRVGGIPELLPADTLVPPDDEPALAAAIARAVATPAWLDRMSRENLARAGEYRADLLAARRRAFYERVRAAATRPV
jgi:phosphatidylinositol alpha-1,6-mannosyltransferase